MLANDFPNSNGLKEETYLSLVWPCLGDLSSVRYLYREKLLNLVIRTTRPYCGL